MTSVNPYEKLSDVYDLLFPRKFYEDYYIFVTKIFEKSGSEPKTVLEIACGTGNLAKIFLDRGYSSEGLDLSKKMLAVAERKGLKTHQGDMVDFDLDKKFDLILCVFDSLNYILDESELLRCLKSVRRHLSRGGFFVFDMNSYHKINAVVPGFGAEYYRVGDVEMVWLNSHEPDTWVTEIIFFEKIEDGAYRRIQEKHVEKAYRMEVVQALLKEAGLELIGVYSDFQFNDVDKDSDRWFFVCKSLH